jgi:hypothetical protein
MSRFSNIVGPSTSHNPTGLHGLLVDSFTFNLNIMFAYNNNELLWKMIGVNEPAACLGGKYVNRLHLSSTSRVWTNAVVYVNDGQSSNMHSGTSEPTLNWTDLENYNKIGILKNNTFNISIYSYCWGTATKQETLQRPILGSRCNNDFSNNGRT